MHLTHAKQCFHHHQYQLRNPRLKPTCKKGMNIAAKNLHFVVVPCGWYSFKEGEEL